MRPSRLAPIYCCGRARYAIDSCQPQLEAIRQGKIAFHALTHGNYPGLQLPPAVLPELASLGFWDGAGAQDWGLETHRNEGIEICFLETGAMAFAVDKRRFDLHAGNLTITRPWQCHKLGAPNIGPGRLHWLILDLGIRRPNQEWRWPKWIMLQPEDLAELTRRLRHNENPVWQPPRRIGRVFRDLAHCILTWQQPHRASLLTIRINQLFVELLDFLVAQPMADHPELTSRRRVVQLFLADLERNPASRRDPWTLEQMAAQCGMGVTAFSAYCRELVNCGPVEFWNQCRLHHAARLLRESPARRITEVAFACGFNSSQYFATAFRKQFHLAPSAYQQHAQADLRPAPACSKSCAEEKCKTPPSALGQTAPRSP